MSRSRVQWAIALVFIYGTGLSLAENRVVAQTQSEPEQTTAPSVKNQIRSQLRSYVDAFNQRRFDELSDLLSAELKYQDNSSGVQFDGAGPFVDRLRAAVEAEPTLKLSATIDNIQLKGEDNAVVRGSTLLKANNVADELSDFVVTMTNAESAWSIESIVDQASQSGAASSGAASSGAASSGAASSGAASSGAASSGAASSGADAIASLEWLTGVWEDSSPEKLLSTIEYLPGRQFLQRTIVDSSSGRWLALELTGYDPQMNSVRSWIYFADGSFGSGYWRGEQDHWSLKLNQVLPDGRSASGTYVIQPRDSDTMTIKLISREIEGEPMPSGKTITLTRRANPPSDKPTDPNPAPGAEQ